MILAGALTCSVLSGCTITIEAPEKDKKPSISDTIKNQSTNDIGISDDTNIDDNSIGGTSIEDNSIEDNSIDTDISDDNIIDDTDENEGTAEQIEFADYINNDLAKLMEIEQKFLNSYGSVSVENYTDDETMYNEIKNYSSVYAQEMQSKAYEIADKIQFDKIKDLHNLFINYASSVNSAMGLMLSGLYEQDLDYVNDANEKLSEANDYASRYKEELQSLADELNMTITEY